jgi:hypothetical protein
LNKVLGTGAVVALCLLGRFADDVDARRPVAAARAAATYAAGNTAPPIVTMSDTQTPPSPSAGTIVLWAANVPAGNTFGNWIKSADTTAAGGIALWNTDNGLAKIVPALAAPQHYVDITFNAEAGTAYHLWIRMRAQNDYFGNDSIHVQFSDAVDAAGSAIYRIGSTGADNSAQVVLQETDGGTISGWGWADQGWNGPGPHIYFATTGTHTLRLQQREDGARVDQIVLSPDTYLTTPPGRQNHDDTIVPVGPPPSDTTPPSIAVLSPAEGATVSGTTTISAGGSDDVGIAGVQFMLDGTNFGGEDTTAPYAMSWDTTAAGNGTYALTARARDAAGNQTTSAAVGVTVSNPGTPPLPGTIVLTAADVPTENIVGNWIKVADSTAADGVALWNRDRGEAKIVPARVAPQHYVDMTFNAEAGTAYHLWIRMRAENDYYGNDSIHVQFSDAVDVGGTALYRIGSSGADNSAQVVLQETDGGILSGWGWADQGWNGLGPQVYFPTSGPHRLRVQQREDGVLFDQIVLSRTTFLTTPPPPGPLSDANHPPVAADDIAAAVEDKTTAIAVLTNDNDVDGDSLSLAGVGTPAHGFAAVNGNGTISYTPPAEFSGADSFTYTVTDANGGNATATVSVIVAPAADAPVAAEDLATTREDTPVVIAVLANDSDADGDALSVVAVDALTRGTAAVQADGTIAYTPEANFSGVSGFSYTVSDGHGGTTTAPVSVTVTEVNDGPVATDDVATTAVNTAVVIPVLANDNDPDGDSISVSVASAPQHGTVAVNADGSVEYTPAAGYSGPDSFSYTIHTGAVTLAWDASSGPDVAGYRIHYGTQPGVYTSVFDVGPAVSGAVHGLVAGQQYYFRASAYNTSRVPSVLSGEVQAVVANPPRSVPETTAAATVYLTIR